MHRRRAGASIPTVHRSGEERLVLVAVVVGVAAGLVGCPVYHFNTLPASEPLPAPVAEAVAGPYVHRSGLTFPEEIGALARVAVARFDTAGLHVGVGYNREDARCPVVATVFLSPAP
jgi:hypothetical protein